MKILNFGSLNIDYVYTIDHIVQKGETILSNKLEVFSGGKGLNQSLALSKAGANVYHAGFIGDDGRFLLDELEESGVNKDLIKVIDYERTGNAIIQNDKDGENCIILFGGSNQKITKEYVEEVISRFDKGDFIVLQNEINELDTIIEKAYERGLIIVLNPSPMNEKIFLAPLDKISYLILNEIEAKQFLKETGSKFKSSEIIKRLKEKFPNTKIIMTMGEKGSIYYDGHIIIEQGIYKAKVVDTTAAGDTYTGYLIAGLCSDSGVKQAMDNASKAASIAVSRMGAAPSIPSLKEVINHEK